MQKQIALLFSLLVLFSLSAHASTAACASDQEAAQPLSATAQSIQALNTQLVASPARSAAPHAMLSTQERTLLSTRRSLVEQLMREHPEQVRSVMLDPARASDLVAADPAAAALIESDKQLTGELTITVADDFEHHTATHLYHLHSRTGDIDLFPTRSLPLDSLLHKQVSVGGVATPAAMAVESAQSALVRPNLQAAGPAPLSCSTTGVQKTVVLILKFTGGTVAYPTGLDSPAYWQQAVTGTANPSVTNYWSEVSYGQTSATTDVFGPITLPQVYDCTTTGAMQTAAISAATGTVDFSQYNRIILVYPVSSCAFGGLGDLGCVGATTSVSNPYSVVWLPVLPTYSTTFPNYAGDLTHELGHNLGLNHANTLDFGNISLGPIDFQATNPGVVEVSGGSTATTPTGAITAINTEYGDAFSTMGGSAFGASGPYSAEHRAKLLNWIPYVGYRYATTDGTYTLVPAENSSGIRALRVLRDPISSSSLWIEYHQPIGYYESANLAAYIPNNIAQGANIHYDDGYGDPTHTYQLDMTPVAKSNNFYDGDLLPGKSWSDPYSLLNITTNSATSAALNVSVSYSAPCATLALSTADIPAAGGNGTLTVTAPSTCAWTAFSNASWMTLTGSTSGTGNGAVTFTAAPNTTQDQRDTYITAQRQSMRVVQEGTTVNILSVTPSYGSALGGTSTVFTLAVDDSAGFGDIAQVNYDMTSGNANCPVSVVFSGTTPYFYLYNSSTASYTSGLAGGAAGTISIAACTLSAQNSGLTVSGNNAQLSMALSFPVTSPGPYSISSNIGASVHSTNTIPLGTFIVNGVPSVGLSPAIGPQGNSIPVLFTGYETHFTSASVLTVDTSGIAATAVNAANPTAIASTLAIAPTTPTGVHTLTITTDSEIVTAPFNVTVPVPSSTSLSAPSALFFPGNSIALTTVVSGGAATKPTGIVTFMDGNAVLGTGTLDSTGTAVFTSTSFAVGSHSFNVVYAGDTIYGHSASGLIAVSVSDFALTSPAAISFTAGATTGNTATITITPGAGGFAAAIALACIGAPSGSTCAVSPASITPGGAVATATITLTTTARAALEPDRNAPQLALPLFGLVFLGLPVLAMRRRLGRMATLFSLILLLGTGLALNGCSSSPSNSNNSGPSTPTGTPAGTSTLLITGTANGSAGPLAHSTSTTVTIN